MKTMIPFLFAIATALCWGLYGPTLGRARTADPDLSPFKPYVAIGVAYLVIAIFGGLIGMWIKGDNFQFTSEGSTWGIIAGTLGALGALFLTLCMFNGGAKIPHSVMPIVFGGAVTVSALYNVLTSTERNHTPTLLWVGILGMLVSVVVITMNTPHPTAAPPKPNAAAVQPPITAGAPQADRGA